MTKMCIVQMTLGDANCQNPQQPPRRLGSILKNPEDAALSSVRVPKVPQRSQSLPATFPSDKNNTAGENSKFVPAHYERSKSYGERRPLSFSTVDIREYKITLGDHPDCSNGPPVTLSWDFDQKDVVELNDYEDHRAPLRRWERRGPALSYYQRKVILLEDAGHSKKELKAATHKKDSDNAKRERTKALIPFMRVEEAIENARRKMKKGVDDASVDPSTGTPNESMKEEKTKRRRRRCLHSFFLRIVK